MKKSAMPQCLTNALAANGSKDTATSCVKTVLDPLLKPAPATEPVLQLTPGVFTAHPYESVLYKTEAEIVAANIMKIRHRLGDKWDLTWAEYKRERLKDGHFSENEQGYFKECMKLIPDAVGAIAFCKYWAKAARAALNKAGA